VALARNGDTNEWQDHHGMADAAFGRLAVRALDTVRYFGANGFINFQNSIHGHLTLAKPMMISMN
jgi:hypothetical protein